MRRLEDRIVIVTGATSGVGRAIANRCVAQGARVVANGRRESALDELHATHPARVFARAGDLAEPGSASGWSTRRESAAPPEVGSTLSAKV